MIIWRTAYDIKLWNHIYLAYIFLLPGFCPEIGHILNGQVLHVTPKVGQAAVVFHCNKTHRLIGKPRLECIKGRWNGSLPFCKSTLEIAACGKNLHSLTHQINTEIPNIYVSLCANKLTLNLSKTVIFQPWQKLNYDLHLHIVLAGKPFDYSFNVKYLGLIIDCHIFWHVWHDNIEYTCSKISKNMNIMTKDSCLKKP